MKKAAVVFILVIGCLFSCVASTRWGINRYVDSFGDQTDVVFIRSQTFVLNPGNYSIAYCSIIIDNDSASIDVDRTTYDSWLIQTKLQDGTVHKYSGDLRGGRVFLGKYDKDKFIKDIIGKCKLVVIPNNKYAEKKFNFGDIDMDMEVLKVVRPDLCTEMSTVK